MEIVALFHLQKILSYERIYIYSIKILLANIKTRSQFSESIWVSTSHRCNIVTKKIFG